MSLFNPEDCFSPDTFFGLPNPRSLDLCILQVCRMAFVFECRARASSEHTADLRGNHSIHAASTTCSSHKYCEYGKRTARETE